MLAGDYPRYVPQYSCSCLPSNVIVSCRCLFPFSTKQSYTTHALLLGGHVILSWVESFPYCRPTDTHLSSEMMAGKLMNCNATDMIRWKPFSWNQKNLRRDEEQGKIVMNVLCKHGGSFSKRKGKNKLFYTPKKKKKKKNVIIIYRSLYSSDMCSRRVCSPNP